jgi:hypothetical protein
MEQYAPLAGTAARTLAGTKLGTKPRTEWERHGAQESGKFYWTGAQGAEVAAKPVEFPNNSPIYATHSEASEELMTAIKSRDLSQVEVRFQRGSVCIVHCTAMPPDLTVHDCGTPPECRLCSEVALTLVLRTKRGTAPPIAPSHRAAGCKMRLSARQDNRPPSGRSHV